MSEFATEANQPLPDYQVGKRLLEDRLEELGVAEDERKIVW